TERQASEAKWADGSAKVTEGVYWVRTKQEDGKTVVVGAVGDPAVEAGVTNSQRAVINLPAILVVVVVTMILVKGIQESAGFNALMVAIKLAAVLFVIA